MSEWTDRDPYSSDPTVAVEALLRMANNDLPSVRRGLKAEIITQAQKTQREVRLQHFLWGAVTAVLLFAGGVLLWPASGGATVAAREDSSPKPRLATPSAAFDAVDWELVESKNQLRRRNLEILRNAF
ncbi:MAG: hypothetical protein KDA84_14550 [Planctomycetaceae bacterium]|nr:hypothetical protein [Planctomycetaceae bacterium]